MAILSFRYDEFDRVMIYGSNKEKELKMQIEKGEKNQREEKKYSERMRINKMRTRA